MSALAPPPAPSRWSWKKTFAVGGLGAGAILVSRVGVYLLVAAFAPSDAFTDEQDIEFDASTMRTLDYEILVDKAELTYDASSSTGAFSLYVMPADEGNSFLSEKPFEHLLGHARENVPAASGSIVLPQGTYALGLACEALDGCDVHLRVGLSPTREPATDDLVSTLHTFLTPTPLWDDASFLLDGWSYLEEPEFFTRVPGTLDVDLDSDRPLEVCLLEADQFALWLVDEPYHAVFCEDGIDRLDRELALDAGDYALLVGCLSDAPCEGNIDVVFRPTAPSAATATAAQA